MISKNTISSMLATALLLSATTDAANLVRGKNRHEKAAPLAQYPFVMYPRVIRVTGSKAEITLAATLSADLNAPGAEVVASHKNGKTTFTYSTAMKKYMKTQGLSKSGFKPLKSYLHGEIKNAKLNPGTYVSMLDAYVRLGMVQSYTLEIQ